MISNPNGDTDRQTDTEIGQERQIPGLVQGERVLVDVDHEVSSGGVVHDEADVIVGLEAALDLHQEGVLGPPDQLQDPPLSHQAVGREVT